MGTVRSFQRSPGDAQTYDQPSMEHAMISGWRTKKSVCFPHFPDISRTFPTFPTSSGLRKLSEPELAAKAGPVPMSFSSPVRHSLLDDARSNEARHGGPQHGEWRSPWSRGDWKKSWPWKMAAEVGPFDLDSWAINLEPPE